MYVVACMHVVVLLCTVLYTVPQYISSPGFLEASVKAVIAVAGTVLPKHHWLVFSRVDRIQSSKEPVPSKSGLSEISLPSACYCWRSISHLSSLLQLVTLPACSLDASCCTILLYFSRYFKIKNVLFFCLFFVYYLCEKHYKAITVQHDIADY